jgi:antitoxin MazE
MVKTLTRHGNSYALIIDKPILELLRIEPATPIEILTDGTVLILAPQRDPDRQARFEEALEEANRRFGQALKRLAE